MKLYPATLPATYVSVSNDPFEQTVSLTVSLCMVVLPWKVFFGVSRAREQGKMLSGYVSNVGPKFFPLGWRSDRSVIYSGANGAFSSYSKSGRTTGCFYPSGRGPIGRLPSLTVIVPPVKS